MQPDKYSITDFSGINYIPVTSSFTFHALSYHSERSVCSITDKQIEALFDQSGRMFVFFLQRIVALTGKPIMWEKIEIPRRRTSYLRQRHCGPDPPTTHTDPFTSPVQDNDHGFFSAPTNRKADTMASPLTLPLITNNHKNHDPEDFSACSDLESGVADLSSRSSCGGDDRKDPDSDEATFTTA